MCVVYYDYVKSRKYFILLFIFLGISDFVYRSYSRLLLFIIKDISFSFMIFADGLVNVHVTKLTKMEKSKGIFLYVCPFVYP